MFKTRLRNLLLLASVLWLAACNPATGTGVKVAEGVGLRDYFVLRSADGRLTTRDARPSDRPREAITGDDYFQIKLEHIYMGTELGRDVGNLAIVTQIEGVLPDGISCKELDLTDLGLKLNERERNTGRSSNMCAFKHVVSINPVFSNGHATFDSAFITPPFRMGRKPVGLRFIVAQLNDTELARQILEWGQDQLNNLSSWGLDELNMTLWQSKLVDIGFTLANYILDYASQPDYVFEYETDFVPIETVADVDSPQNLFMGGDYMIVGFPHTEEVAKVGAVGMAEQLVFDSGRLNWKATKEEYRDGAYIIFKVVRESRYPGELPVNLAKVSRSIERGNTPAELAKTTKNLVLDMQDARILNETEGAYLKDLIAWFTEASVLEIELEAAIKGQRQEQAQWPMQMRDVGMAIGPDLSMLQTLALTKGTLETLDERIFLNYAKSPGMWQAECVAVRGVTQGLADNYRKLYPKVKTSVEDLKLARLELDRKVKRTPTEDTKRQQLSDTEVWADREFDGLPTELQEPECPALRH
ncbi:MAG: hypothetical protein AUK47_12705 [Deltaproteobacteria bacterium CG2_30_63_29]|nr:MAG: hypothetical protein AUK47_12705 [Deltaproteobacteria bacterium CG2_30_63_29]